MHDQSTGSHTPALGNSFSLQRFLRYIGALGSKGPRTGPRAKRLWGELDTGYMCPVISDIVSALLYLIWCTLLIFACPIANLVSKKHE